MLYAYKKGTESWFKKFFDAFSFYIASDDEKAKADGILSMLYVVGHEGKIKYYRDDRLAMLCRMLYRQLGILLWERTGGKEYMTFGGFKETSESMENNEAKTENTEKKRNQILEIPDEY